MEKVGSVCDIFFSIVALGACEKYESRQHGMKNSSIYVLKVRT